MKKKIFKCAKAALAATLAVTLAVPVTTMLTSTGVRAEEAFPQPIEVYNFNTYKGLTMSALAVENEGKIRKDADRNSNVYKYDDAMVVTAEAVMTTKVSVGVTTIATGVTEEVFEDVTYPSVVVVGNNNSSAEIKNPFYGRTELTKDHIGYLESNGAPIWETGVTISYWQKTAGTGKDSDGVMLTFNNTREQVMHKDDKVKYKLAQLYYKDPTNPIFSLGEVKDFDEMGIEKDGSKWYYNDIEVKGVTTTVRNSKIYSNFGMFVNMNPAYEKIGYYINPSKDTAGNITKYTMTALKTPINISAYKELMSENSMINYGTEKGCLTFTSSATWGFIEGGMDTQYYINGVLQKDMLGSLNRGNNAAAYTYVLNGEEKIYQKVVDADDNKTSALVDNSEWHYVTYVIKNDSISLYVDGVLQDEALYTNKATTGVDCNKAFNLGWGYYTSTSDSGIIKAESDDKLDIFYQGAIATVVSGNGVIYDENNQPVLGYNGNTDSITIMEFLVNECTSLFIGEDGNNSKWLDVEKNNFKYGLNYGTAAGNMIDSIAFFDQPLDGDQVAALYEAVQVADLVSPNGEDPEEEYKDDQPTPGPGETDQPAPGPTETTSPTVTDEPSSGPSVTTEPVTGMKGDVNDTKDVTLEDANIVLKMALGIGEYTNIQKELGDVDESGDVTLEDANQVLKMALGIIKEFEVVTKTE